MTKKTGRVWCSRCGHLYEKTDERGLLPVCECAGDPPVDRDSTDYALWLKRVFDLAYEETK